MSAPSLAEFFECFPGLAFIADRDGTMVCVSRALEQRFGERLGVGATLAAWVVPADRDVIEAFLRELADSEGPVTCTVRTPQAGESDASVRCIARRSSTGLIHAQLELVAPAEQAADRIERALLRAILDTLEIVLWAIDDTGKFVFHDGKAVTTAGVRPGQFLGMNVFDLFPGESGQPIRAALEGTPSHYTSEAFGVHWETWNIPIENDAGQLDYCVGLTLDNTASVRTELELKDQLDTIRKQQRAIHELSAPVLRIWDSVLTVPLIGTMDVERTDDITERLLAEASRSQTRFAILDLTGVESLDTSIADRLLRLLGSLRLLGVEGMISGISPDVALTMVGLGIQLASVHTHGSLREALRYCMGALERPS